MGLIEIAVQITFAQVRIAELDAAIPELEDTLRQMQEERYAVSSQIDEVLFSYRDKGGENHGRFDDVMFEQVNGVFQNEADLIDEVETAEDAIRRRIGAVIEERSTWSWKLQTERERYAAEQRRLAEEEQKRQEAKRRG